MLAEKLLLNVLITLAPVLFFSILNENSRKMNSPFLCGLLTSIAALACMVFSYSNYGFKWDLRYVPLILAFLYGGPIPGGMVLTTLLGARIIMGGDTVVFGVVNTLFTALFPVLLMKIFWNNKPKQRVIIATLIGAWSLLLCYFSLTTFRYFEGNFFKLDFNIPDLLLVGQELSKR
jgi:two-component system, sporulation sensor kinase B